MDKTKPFVKKRQNRNTFKILGIIFTCIGFVPMGIGVVLKLATGQMAPFIICLVMGSILILFGIVSIIVSSGKRKRIERLKTEGMCVNAVISEIKKNYAVKINGHTASTVYCIYTDESTGSQYTFASGYTTRKYTVGATVQVYVMKDNFKEYFIDLDQLG